MKKTRNRPEALVEMTLAANRAPQVPSLGLEWEEGVMRAVRREANLARIEKAHKAAAGLPWPLLAPMASATGLAVFALVLYFTLAAQGMELDFLNLAADTPPGLSALFLGL